MKKMLREWGEALLVALVLTVVIRTFVVQAFKIPSGSMEDTLLVGDYLLVNKFLYGTEIPFTDIRLLEVRAPQRGDVIVFVSPDGRDFIKRIMGLPGDTVTVTNKQLFINGQLVTIPQEVHKDRMTTAPGLSPRDFFGPVTVPPDSYFVMGDNRDHSSDSRFWGFVPRENIKGLAFIKYWSWDSDNFMPRLGRIFRPVN